MNNTKSCDNADCPFYKKAKVIEKCVALYEGGLSLRDVAAQVGKDRCTISDYLKMAGVKIRPSGHVGGETHPSWRGGRNVSCGYVRIRNRKHPMANKDGVIVEHRLVMAEHLGRSLRPEEVVHHVDGDGLNNNIENLVLFASNEEHLRFHAQSEFWFQKRRMRMPDDKVAK